MAVMERETYPLVSGWVTTRDAAKELGLAEGTLRKFLSRHPTEVVQKLVGRTLMVNMNSLREARRGI